MNNKKEKYGQIRMEGKSSREVAYDVMDVTVTFRAREKNSQKVLAELDKQTEDFLKVFKELGFEIKSFQIGNNNVEQHRASVVPPWLRRELRDKEVDIYLDREEDYATGERVLKLALPFNMKVRNIIDQAVLEEKLSVDIDTSYRVAKEPEIREELIREAIAKSKALAEVLATSANQRIIGVKEIVKDDYVRSNHRFVMASYAPACALEAKPKLSDEVSADKTVLDESIEIVWLIGQ